MKHALRSLFSLPVFIVFGLAVAVRYLYNTTVALHYFPKHDSLTYQTIAYSILHDHCYCLLPHQPTVDRAPLWPTMIAVIYALLGDRDRRVRLILCFVGALTCLLIYFFVKDLFGKRIALFAGILAAVYPCLYIYDGWLYSESVYTCLLIAFCYTLYRLQRRSSWSLALVAGLLLALLSLTRPNGLLILCLCILWLIFLGWRKIQAWRAVLQNALIITCVTLLLLTPWTIRNFQATKSFVPIAIGDGKVLIGAYNDMILRRPEYLAIWIKPWESRVEVFKRFPENCSGPCEVARDNAYKQDAEQWARTHLQELPRLLALHALNLWQIDSQEADLPLNRHPEEPSSQLVILLIRIFTPIVFALAAFGLFAARRYWRELLFCYLIIAVTIAQSIYFYGIARFRAPIEPILLILSAATVWWITQKFQRRTTLVTPAPSPEAQTTTT